jgi:hypothetical protein
MLGSMPWPIRDLLTMKQELVEFALRPGVNRRALFSRYGISPGVSSILRTGVS